MATNQIIALQQSPKARQKWSLIAGLLIMSAAALSTKVQAAEAGLDACNVTGFQTVLESGANAFESRAYWLNHQLIQWPNVDEGGEFRLYFSNSGKIAAKAGAAVTGADGFVPLAISKDSVPQALATRFKFVAKGAVLKLSIDDLAKIKALHQQQLILVQQGSDGTVRNVAALQIAGALDDLYAQAKDVADLGVTVKASATSFKLWAPTAQKVSICTYATGSSAASTVEPLRWDDKTGVWSATKSGNLSGQYYDYLVDVFVPGVGIVRNKVTDPYSVSLTTDSKRSYIASLDSSKLKPAGWSADRAPAKVKAATDMSIYELHVRDFSINDNSVSAANRGKYLAFTEANSNGMKHLKALAEVGLTDIHLLPVFDSSTVPEGNCVTPTIVGGPDSETQQATIKAVEYTDCFNWGYDPYHYGAPEGSYASDPADGARRVIEFRQMVQALHRAGLRVGMDVVYNHTFADGQNEKSVLDRIVPGYYQRLNDKGEVEHSTCCSNTATENLMMGKLLVDTVIVWAKEYNIDSFRFDLMAHQPRAVMEELQARLRSTFKREVQLLGEGWNFGEIENGRRFVQASQLSLNGTGIGTFSDRARDLLRGSAYDDSGIKLVNHKGYISGLTNPDQSPIELRRAADMARVGLAGSLRNFELTTYTDERKPLEKVDYSGQPAGYVSQPSEVVNYIENHDNQTLFDMNVYKLPTDTSREDRARVQLLGAAFTAFSQGIAYFHAGMDILRSKSLDRDSFNSGDWFNRLDWTYQDNYFPSGLPPKAANGDNYFLMKPLLNNPLIKPTSKEIIFTRDGFRDLLRIRASSTLFRLRTAQDVQQRLHFYNTGSKQNPAVVVGHLDGKKYAGAGFKSIAYFLNVAPADQELDIPELKGLPLILHPVHTNVKAADKRVAAVAKYDPATGKFHIPARSTVVFIER